MHSIQNSICSIKMLSFFYNWRTSSRVAIFLLLRRNSFHHTNKTWRIRQNHLVNKKKVCKKEVEIQIDFFSSSILEGERKSHEFFFLIETKTGVGGRGGHTRTEDRSASPSQTLLLNNCELLLWLNFYLLSLSIFVLTAVSAVFPNGFSPIGLYENSINKKKTTVNLYACFGYSTTRQY